MKTSITLSLALLAVVAGCAAPATEDVAGTEEWTSTAASAASSLQRHVYVGSFALGGATYGLELEVVTATVATLEKRCALLGDHVIATYDVRTPAGAPAGYTQTTVLASDGTVLARSPRVDISSVSGASFAPGACTASGELADTDLLAPPAFVGVGARVPGLAAELPTGTVWINPGYGGPTSHDPKLTGFASFHDAAGPAEVAVIERSPDQPASAPKRTTVARFEEASFSLQGLTERVELSIGWDIQSTGLGASKTQRIALRRR